MQTFRGRTAVVTGAASGMGLAMARRFGREGMRVILADVNGPGVAARAAELRGEGVIAFSQQVDVADPASVEALADRAYAAFGAVHVLCNNAGVGAPLAKTWEHSLDTWKWLLGVNVWGVVHGVRSFVPRMLAGGDEGHIVNTASMAGVTNGSPSNAPYWASKHAVVSITESLFRELKMDGANISASVLCPGYVNTGFNENSDRDRPRSEGDVLVPRAESSMASLPGVFQPERIADEVFAAINEDRFYIFAAQDELLGWMAMRNRRMEDGRNPAVPRRSLQ